MKRPLMRLIPALLVYLLLSCGLTVFAAEMPDKLYPSDVQTAIADTGRQIIKIYTLSPDRSPVDITREGFERDGWAYTHTDTTEKKTSSVDTRTHTETVTINTHSKDLNDILALLAPTMEYQAEDGYCGLIYLDLETVICEPAGYKNSSYTVSATREYPHLSTNDLSLIPKTITDNGRTLELADVTWEVESFSTVDYDEIPDSYKAIAIYTAKATRSVVTGYTVNAEYTGELSKTIPGDTVYTVTFTGEEIRTPEPDIATPESLDNKNLLASTFLFFTGLLMGCSLSMAMRRKRSKERKSL